MSTITEAPTGDGTLGEAQKQTKTYTIEEDFTPDNRWMAYYLPAFKKLRYPKKLNAPQPCNASGCDEPAAYLAYIVGDNGFRKETIEVALEYPFACEVHKEDAKEDSMSTLYSDEEYVYFRRMRQPSSDKGEGASR